MGDVPLSANQNWQTEIEKPKRCYMKKRFQVFVVWGTGN